MHCACLHPLCLIVSVCCSTSQFYDANAGLSRIGLGGVVSAEYSALYFLDSNVTDARSANAQRMQTTANGLCVAVMLTAHSRVCLLSLFGCALFSACR